MCPVCVWCVSGLTYHSELSVGENSSMLVLSHTLVHADVGQPQAVDGQDAVIHLNPVLKHTHINTHINTHT